MSKFIIKGYGYFFKIIISVFMIAILFSPKTYAITTTHPRILLTPNVINKIKCRVGLPGYENIAGETFGSHKASFDKLHDTIHLPPDMSGWKKVWHALALGILYHGTGGDTRYSDTLINYAMSRISTTSRRDAATCMVLAMTYDWFYDLLTEQQKIDIEHTMQTSTYIYSLNSGHASVHGAWNGHYLHEEGWTYAGPYMALAGESLTDSDYNGTPIPVNTYGPSWMLSKCNNEMKNNILPAWDQASGTNGGSQMGWGTYEPTTKFWNIFYLKAWRDAGIEDLLSSRPHLLKATEHAIFGLRPNKELVAEYNDDGESNWSDQGIMYCFHALLADEFNNQYSQWILNQIDPAKTGVNGPIWTWTKPAYILWYDHNRPARTPNVTDLGDSLYSDGTGVVISRTGWGNEDMMLYFHCGDYYDGHSHLNNNDFQIYYKGDLAIKSGSYSGDVNDQYKHYQNYYKRTISSNSILIYDPDEIFYDYMGGVNRHNDGGQTFPYGTVCSGTTYRPQCYGDVTPGSAWDRGDILAYENNNKYTYVLGDAHNSYNPEKCTVAKRTIVRFKDAKDIVIVDNVSTTSAKPNLEKKWVLHTMDYPTVVGSLGSDSRNEYGGGIVNYTDASMIKVTDISKSITSPGVTSKNHIGGDGKLFIIPVFPENNKVTLTGGPSNANEHYTDDSYEFYYDGQQHRQYRHDDTPEMGAWRIEISPDGTDVGKDNIFLNIIHVTDSDSDVPSIEKIDILSNNMVGAMIKGSNAKIFLFSSTYDAAPVVEDITFSLSDNYANTPCYLFNMPENTNFTKTISSNNGLTTVTIKQDPSGSLTSTAKGVLMVDDHFDINLFNVDFIQQ